MTRFITALNKKRASFNSDKGFTLIELLVVVIIIGILAAIAIPVYIGVQNNAKNSATVTDLTNAKLAVVAYYSDKGIMPTAYTSTVLSDYGYTGTGTGAPAIAGPTVPTVTSFCLSATSASAAVYYITDKLAPTTTKPTPCT